MRSERIEKTKFSRKVTFSECLPLDLAIRNVVHAKELTETRVPPCRRAS